MSNSSVSKFILLIMAVSTQTAIATGQSTAFVKSSRSNLRGNQYRPRISLDTSRGMTYQDNIRLRGSMKSSRSQIRSAVRQRHNTHHGDENNATDGNDNGTNEGAMKSRMYSEIIETAIPASTINTPQNQVRMLKKKRKKKRDKSGKSQKNKKDEKKQADPMTTNDSSRSIPPENTIPSENDGVIEIEHDETVTSTPPSMSPTSSSSVMDSYSDSMDEDALRRDIEGWLPEVLDDREGFLPNDDNDLPSDEERSFNSEFVSSASSSMDEDDLRRDIEGWLPPVLDDREGFLPNGDNDVPSDEERSFNSEFVPSDVVDIPSDEVRSDVIDLPADEERSFNSEFVPSDVIDIPSDEVRSDVIDLPSDEERSFNREFEPSTEDLVRSHSSGDVELISRTGARSVMTSDPILDAVEITHQDTSTVTMNLYQVWENKPGYALDFFYYYYHEPGKHFWGNAKCYERTWVPHSASRRVDAIQIACNQSQPYAELEICLVDNASHATLIPSDQGDKAELPRMCKHSPSPSELSTCYQLKISCTPRIEDLDY